MNYSSNLTKRCAIVVAFVLGAITAMAQPTGQWDFDNGNLNGTVGAALQYVDGPNGPTQTGTQFGTTAALGIPNIGGSPAQVMKFAGGAAGTGYVMPAPAAANGGGALVNDWTLIMDILFPAASNSKLRALVETDLGQIDPDSEFFVLADNGLGSKGQSFGKILPDTWHRIGIVVDGTAGMIRVYIDGVQVGVRRVANLIDGRFALTPGSAAHLFADDTGETAVGYVNSIQLRNVALSKDQMRAFAGPAAAGIPQALPPIPSGIEQWIPAGDFASRNTAVGAIITLGSTTIQDSSISVKLNGQAQANPSITRSGGLITVRTAPLNLTPGVDYTLELTFTDSLAGQKTLSKKFTAALFYEDFEGLDLKPRKDETNAATEPFEKAWTHTPPAGWKIDNSQFLATIIGPDNPDDDKDGYADNDGRTEWAGWSFANKDFWIAADNQTRDQFSLAQGTIAVADNDEWDDLPHVPALFNSFLTTPEISLEGVAPNSATLRFASSWRPEAQDDPNASRFLVGPNGEAINNQTAIVTVSFDGAAPVQIFKYDSIQGSPTFKGDAQNEAITISLKNPAGAKKMVLTFEMREAANDWWWAVDNVVVTAGTGGPPTISQQPKSIDATEGQAASLSVTATGDALTYQWFKGQGSGKKAVAGATKAALDFAAVGIEDAGYYSVEVKNSFGTAASGVAKLTVLPRTTGRMVLLDENFDKLPLGPNVEEGITTGSGGPRTNVWTKTPPAGWSIDDSGVPGAGTDGDGVTEWAGWSFADRAWWAATAGDQQRTGFTKGTGASAIADSDEWDDIAHDAGNMATFLKTKPISLQGVKPKSVILKYDSSWRPESPQKASVAVSFDGATPVEVVRYESDPANPNFRPDEVNETITVRIDNPAGAKNMQLIFGYFDTRNNWWWAIDNLLVVGDAAGLFFEDFNSVPLGPNVEEGITTGSGGARTNVWTKTPPAGWVIDDSGVPGAGTATDGVKEWAGWSFADRAWWAATAGDQRRSEFTKGTGAVAVADGDEWDDLPRTAGTMNTFLRTPAIDISGAAANSLVLTFDSSWRDEPNQKANVRVSYDGGAPIEVLRWESVEGGPNFHNDAPNETVTVPLKNPAGAKSMVITFGYLDAGNNWWWAIDNIQVEALATPPPAGLTISSVAVSGANLTLNWTGGTGPFVVQVKTSLSETIWLNVLTTPDRTVTIPRAGTAAFFRVAEAQGAPVTFTALLSGAAERPNPVTTTASGLGTFQLSGNTLTYDISYAGLSAAATAGHIHGPGTTDQAVGVLQPFTGVTGTAGRLMGTLTLTDAQRTNVLAGLTYANIHTSTNPGGEIRGQLVPTQLRAVLSGANERPNPVTTSATGLGNFALLGNLLVYNISYSGLSAAATAGHIHGPGGPNEAVGVMLPFSGVSGTSGTISGLFLLTPAQLAAIADGKTYVNIHTSTNPGGEIRGQILP